MGYIREKAYFAIAQAYDVESLPAALARGNTQGLALFKQKNKICVGDTAELLTPGQVGRPFTVRELYDEEGQALTCAPHPSQHFYIRTPFDVREGDILRAGDASGDMD